MKPKKGTHIRGLQTGSESYKCQIQMLVFLSSKYISIQAFAYIYSWEYGSREKGRGKILLQDGQEAALK